MAEPARRIYDQDQPEKNIRPDLRAVEGTGGKAPENLREAEEDAGSKDVPISFLRFSCSYSFFFHVL